MCNEPSRADPTAVAEEPGSAVAVEGLDLLCLLFLIGGINALRQDSRHSVVGGRGAAATRGPVPPVVKGLAVDGPWRIVAQGERAERPSAPSVPGRRHPGSARFLRLLDTSWRLIQNLDTDGVGNADRRIGELQAETNRRAAPNLRQ